MKKVLWDIEPIRISWRIEQMEQYPMTKDGHEALVMELEKLKTKERPDVIASIAEARSHGDLKENAEYHAARERQGFIEGRIDLLEDRLSRAQIIDFSGQSPDQVKFGAWVTVCDEDTGEEQAYRIVGDLEADIEQNKISISSPIAKALMGKRLDDAVVIRVPKGTKELCVLSITYEEPA